MLLSIPGSGFLAYGSSYSLHLPSRTTSGLLQVSSPFTVAGQRRTCTGFPILQGVQVTTCTVIWSMMRGSSRSRRARKRISLRVEESVEKDTQCPPPAAIIAALHPLQYYFFGPCGCALALDVLRVHFQGPQSCHQAFSTLAFLLGML